MKIWPKRLKFRLKTQKNVKSNNLKRITQSFLKSPLHFVRRYNDTIGGISLIKYSKNIEVLNAEQRRQLCGVQDEFLNIIKNIFACEISIDNE